MPANLELIALAHIEPSPTNPRQRMDEGQLNDLTESIKAHGVLQPVLVRRRTDREDRRFQLIAGHRRVAAARLAGLLDIPATIHELNDAQALELQVVENLQRADLHPLEEAEGYLALHQEHEYSVEAIAAKVGKSKGYVYGRMQLARLPEAAKQVFWKGEVNASLALLIARIPDAKLQARAAAEILEARQSWVDGKSVPVPMTHREASELVRKRYMLELKSAPFDTAAIYVLPGLPDRGSCAACPLRTGNAVDLFGDVKDHDLCTDPPCFEKKRVAAWDLEAARAAAKGATVLTLAQSKKPFPEHSRGEIGHGSGFVRPTDKVPGDRKKRTYAALVKDSELDVRRCAARHPVTGKAVELYRLADIEAARGEGKKPAAKAEAEPATAGRDWQFDGQVSRIAGAEADRIVSEAAAATSASEILALLGRLVARDYRGRGLAIELGLPAAAKDKVLNAWVSTLAPGDLHRLIASAITSDFAVDIVGAVFGFDYEKLREQAHRELLAAREADKAKAAAAPAKAAKAKQPVKAKKGRKS